MIVIMLKIEGVSFEKPSALFANKLDAVPKITAKNKWEKIKLPFNNFKKSNFYQPKQFNYHKIRTIGIVAGFENFKSDISVSEIGFY